MNSKSKFQPHDIKMCNYALGPLSNFPLDVQSLFEKTKKACKLLKKPKQGEWLYENYEGQTFKSYITWLKMQEGFAVSENRNIIYLIPLDKGFSQEFLSCLVEYCRAFFQLEIQLLTAQDLTKLKIESRINEYTGTQQYCAPDIFNRIDKFFPRDGFCIVGITNQDLFIDENNNFVFGLADPRCRKAVFSFNRFDDVDQNFVLQRSCKILSHEISHLFAIKHCAYFKCVMNGSNHLQEDDEKPMFLCPVCLKKLQYATGFDIKKRYQELVKVCKAFQGKFIEVEKFYEEILN